MSQTAGSQSKAHGVSAVLIDDLQRINAVAQRLGHFPRISSPLNRKDRLTAQSSISPSDQSESWILSVSKQIDVAAVSIETIEQAVDRIESKLLNSLEREVTSYQIGELAMEQLKSIDEIAYVRFASVYRQFADVNTFMNEIKQLLTEK